MDDWTQLYFERRRTSIVKRGNSSSMKGMWTKQLTNEGKIFYYNSSLNKSLWTAPLDAILHEAENLTPLHIPEQGEISEYVEITQNVQNNNHAVRMAGVNSSVVQINVQSLDAK